MRGKDITLPAHGLDDCRFLRILAEALPQAADLDVDRAVVGAGLARKHQVDQLVAGQHAVGMLDKNLQQAETLRAQAKTVVFLGVDEVAIAIAAVADPIKGGTPEALAELKRSGVRIVMLTGDSRRTAEAVAQQLGIDEALAEVLPEDKAGHVKRLQSEGHKIAMAGDGINDAPALAQADVGIAMGTGTDVAMESAGVTLIKGDLRGIARAAKLSRATMRNIRQNLVFAFGYNALGIPIAAGLLYPSFGILLSPIFAGAAMALSSVSVVTNALRLRRQSAR